MINPYHAGVFDTTSGNNRDSTLRLTNDDGTAATIPVFISPVRYHAQWNVSNPSGARQPSTVTYFITDPNNPGTYTASPSLVQDPSYPGTYSVATSLNADANFPGTYVARTN